jgi:hypothetical protein
MCTSVMFLSVSELMRCKVIQQKWVPSLGMKMLCHQEVAIPAIEARLVGCQKEVSRK